MNGGMGIKTRAKAYSRCLFIMYMHFHNSRLTDKAPQTFMQNPRKKEQARKPLLFLRAGMTGTGPERPGWLPGHPRGDSMGFWSATLGICLVVNAAAVVTAAWLVQGLAARPTFHGRLPTLRRAALQPPTDSPMRLPLSRLPTLTLVSRLWTPDSRLSPTAQPNWLLGVPARLFIGSGGARSFTFDPSPPAGSAPLTFDWPALSEGKAVLIRFASHACTRTW